MRRPLRNKVSGYGVTNGYKKTWREYTGMSRKFRLYGGLLIFLRHSTSTMTSTHPPIAWRQWHGRCVSCERKLPRVLAKRYHPYHEERNSDRDREWKAIYLPPNERIRSFRHRHFFFRLISCKPTLRQYFRILSAASRTSPEKKHQFLRYKSSEHALITRINRVRSAFVRYVFLNY